MTIINQYCKILLVFTKKYIFKKLINIALFFILIFMTFTSYTDKFPVPLWITFLESSDGNIHTCHRKDYLEFRELVNFDEPIDEELDYNYKYYDYLIWEKIEKFEERKKIDKYLGEH